ncbi:MAG TPA: STAS domain-containing protein [Acetobacteraceae bacterium]|jgi:anti-anti-sigma factor|nr:STAS domain-containing protein [Acetobacteraceae bacterium]
MKMAVEPVGPGVVKVILDGRLDVAGSGIIDLQFSAIAGSHRGVVVDLAGVSFLASIGIRTLLLGAKAVQRRGGSFILLNPVEEVERVLEVMGMTDLMPVFHDADTALAAAAAQA